MTLRSDTLSLAIAITLGSLATLPAAAAPLTVFSAVVFDNEATVADSKGGGATTATNAALGTSTVTKFDPSLGVLVGAQLQLSSQRQQTTTMSAAVGNGSGGGNNNMETGIGVGSSTARMNVGGTDYDFGQISATATCSALRRTGCSASAVSGASDTSLSVAVAADSLNAYAGAGEALTMTRTAPSLVANQTSNQFQGAEQTATTVQWAGEFRTLYTYLEHASASFNGGDQRALDLNFGTVDQGSDPLSLAFSIFNAANRDGGARIGLDLDSFGADAGPFSTDLLGFTNLAAGHSNAFRASMDTDAVGVFQHSYTLQLSDADQGAASSRWSYQLKLNVTGTVQARQTVDDHVVPEPGALALAGLGLLALVATCRRRPAR